jgi:hypothetical protein
MQPADRLGRWRPITAQAGRINDTSCVELGSTGIDWSDPRNLTNTDPYIVWADVRASEVGIDPEPWVNCLVELVSADAPGQLAGVEHIPTHLRAYGTNRFLCVTVPARTGAYGRLVNLAIAGTAVRRLELSMPRINEYRTTIDPAVPPARLANRGASHREDRPRIDPAAGPSKRLRERLERLMRLNQRRQAKLAESFSIEASRQARALGARTAAGMSGELPPTGSNTSGPPMPLVCVVDDRCNFASAELWSPQKTPRVVSIWHQGRDDISVDRLARDWTSAAKRGGVLTADPCDIDADPFEAFACHDGGALYGRVLQVASVRVGQHPRTPGPPLAACRPRKYGAESPLPADDESGIYGHSGYLSPSLNFSHGAAVLGTIAGTDAAIGERRCGIPRARVPEGIRFVQLPTIGVLDTSGRSLGGNALDAMHHALEEAEDLVRGTDKPPPPVIVNLSYGTHSGPHDGTSLFERAIDDLLNTNPNLHVVLPAGNTHLLRVHAHGWLNDCAPSTTLYWKVRSDNPSDSFVEIWLPAEGAVEVEVMPPGLPPSPPVTLGSAWLWEKAPKRGMSASAAAAVVFVKRPAQGPDKSMVLIAAAPTEAVEPEGVDPALQSPAACPAPRPARRLQSPHGVWQIKLRKREATAPVAFDAWVQRGDTPPGRRRSLEGDFGRQSYFLDQPDEDARALNPDPYVTLSGIATGRRRLDRRLSVVGAMQRGDSSLSIYTAAGPARGHADRPEGPDVVTIADESLNQSGLLTSGVLSWSRRRVSGTSIAAAVFSRVLFDHLAQGNPAATLCWAAPGKATRERPHVAGEPRLAVPFHRGETARFDPKASPLPACRERSEDD